MLESEKEEKEVDSEELLNGFLYRKFQASAQAQCFS